MLNKSSKVLAMVEDKKFNRHLIAYTHATSSVSILETFPPSLDPPLPISENDDQDEEPEAEKVEEQGADQSQTELPIEA